MNEIVSQIEGESIADLLDFLSKELIRLQEERRIHAIRLFQTFTTIFASNAEKFWVLINVKSVTSPHRGQ